MKEYATKDIANIVNIAPATVRKYAQILERNGYSFTKNDKGNRIFIDSDIEIFQQINDKSKNTGMNVDSIAQMLINQRKGDMDNAIQGESYTAILKQNDENKDDSLHSDIVEIKKALEQQQEFNQMLLKKLDEQNEYIKQSLEVRDQRLLEAIRESQQAKLEAAATSQENKKSFWSRIFNR